MMEENRFDSFTVAAEAVGTRVVRFEGIAEAAAYIGEHAQGSILLPPLPSLERSGLYEQLNEAEAEVVCEAFRDKGPEAAAGVTGVNFALADTGTLVLDSTDENVRLATTLPERHFAILDPRKILADGLEAVEPMRNFQARDPRNYIAYITGPSRTADIERVLTIGVHGPKELHVLIVEGISDNLLEG